MKTRMHVAAALGAPALVLWAAPATHAQYLPGHSWHRSSDWVPGGNQGSSLNNPSPDGQGNPSWRYEWATGGPLGSESPWYTQPGNLMTWDAAWWSTGFGVWSGGGDDINPPIFHHRLTHNLLDTTYARVPVVQWVNPTGDGAAVDIAGSLRVVWTGPGFLGSPVDVDVVLALHDASEGTTSPLFSTTLSKPIGSDTVGDQIILPISLNSVAFDADDSILVSMRGHDSFAPYGRWIDMYDDLTITLVPAPGAAALLGLAALTMGRRRRAS